MSDWGDTTRDRGPDVARMQHTISRVSDFPPGTRRIVEVGGRSIGVFNVSGRFFALRNSCPHQGGPLCLGRIGGTNHASRPYELVYDCENEIIRCPWHGWEFEIATGRSIFNPHRVRVRVYPVTIEHSAEGGTADDDDPAIETFPVTIEDGVVILHV